MVDGVLNNARRLQTASEAYLHDAVVVDGIRPPMKPDKGRVAKIAQPKSLDWVTAWPWGAASMSSYRAISR